MDISTLHLVTSPTTLAHIQKTIDRKVAYVARFETEAATSKTAAELIKAMQTRYPDFTNQMVLDLSAKVLKDEMQWP